MMIGRRCLVFRVALLAWAQGVALALSVSAVASEPLPGFDQRPAGSVLGIEVRSADKVVGRLIDLLARPDGSIEAAVIEYGGFLGIGSRKVAVDWYNVRLEQDGQQLVAVVGLTTDELRAAPEYKPGQAGILRAHRFPN